MDRQFIHPRVLVDVDGVIADFVGGLIKAQQAIPEKDRAQKDLTHEEIGRAHV